MALFPLVMTTNQITFSDINDCLLILQGPLKVSFHG